MESDGPRCLRQAHVLRFLRAKVLTPNGDHDFHLDIRVLDHRFSRPAYSWTTGMGRVAINTWQPEFPMWLTPSGR